MPTGRVQRVDDDRRCAYIISRGHSYEAPITEVESAARVPGARVTYKIRRRAGTETAFDVRLRRGMRTNKSQRRFGDLTGVRYDGSKGVTAGQNAYGVDVATGPLQVAKAWVEAMSNDDDAAADLYLPGATVHVPEGLVAGRRSLRRLLSQSPWARVSSDQVSIGAYDRLVRVERREDPDLSKQVDFLIEDGLIIEQWIGVDADPLGPPSDEERADVYIKGAVAPSEVDHLHEQIDRLRGGVGHGTSGFQAKLMTESTTRGEPTHRAQVTCDLGTDSLRTHAAGATMAEAVDRAVARLRQKLEHHRDRYRHNPTAVPAPPGRWHHGSAPTPRPPYFDRPVEERQIVRHKSYAPDELTVAEAASDLELLDYEFLLFVDTDRGRDCVLASQDDGQLVLHDIGDAEGGAVISDRGTVSRSPEVVPCLRPSEAMALLGESGRRWLFFENASTRRGNVIYHRYDGHYGLITPADEV